MKGRVRLWIALALAAVVVIAGVVYWRRQVAMREAAADQPTTVVGRGTLRVTVTASGGLEPEAEVNLSFDLPGRVDEVLVDIGDEVVAGQPLARLETSDLERAVQQAELTLRQAELRLERITQPADETDISRAQHAVDQAAAALEVAQINLDGVLNSVLLNESLEDARSAFDDAKERYESYLREYEEGERDYWYVDQAEQRYEDTELALERVQQQVDLQLESAQNEVSRAWQTYQEAQDNLELLLEGADELDLETARLDVDAAELGLERAVNDLENAVLVAPFGGLVSAVNVEVEELAPTGLPAVSLVDPSRFEITISADEIDVAVLDVGLPVEVTVDAFPDLRLSGVVERIGPAAVFTEGAVAYPVVISVDETDTPLRAGMSATTVIMVEELENQLLIPNWVVRVDQTTGQTYVHRQIAEGLERVDIELGIRYEGSSQVLGGLEEGDVLVLVRENNGFFGMR
jgi:HlyD family secretion protein